jgi:recombinational DNA repair protein (RecF pathway)
MNEYSLEAIVLNKEPNGDFDSRVSLFTHKFGKLNAKAKSARKIVSKLSAHLEPGNLISVRLIEKNGFQITDALIKRKLKFKSSDLYFLDSIFPEAEPETDIWELFQKMDYFDWQAILRILGWDPEYAICEICRNQRPSCFSIKNQTFLCANCSLKTASKEVIYIGNERQ